MKTTAEFGSVPLVREKGWGLAWIENRSLEWRLQWLLRIGVFMEFVGHGACGVHTKAGWLPYFHVFAIPDGLAMRLMPLIGFMDIALGVTALLIPFRAILLYMAGWAFFTALLRPAAGEGGWEFIERAYNYGVPTVLLLLYGFGRDVRSWFVPLAAPPALSEERARRLLWILRVIVALMLIGHGGFGPFMGKANLLGFYRAAGLGAMGLPVETVRAGVGFFEIGLGIVALFANRPAFFGFVCAWKLAFESLYLVSGASLACWEIIERGGSYVAPLAALCVLALLKASPASGRETRGERLPVPI